MTPRKTERRRRVKPLRLIGGLLILAWIATTTWHSNKPLPDGFNQAFPARPAHQIRWLHDLSWTDPSGQQRYQHEIFDYQLSMIEQARHLIVLDMFLFNDFAADVDERFRALSSELSQALIRQREAHPQLRVMVITDPINTVYGGLVAPHFQAMRDAGIEVIITPLAPLPDSNPAWSGLWRLCCRWAGNNDNAGWLPNPLGEDPVTLRSYLHLLNFKANHRKTLISDQPDGWRAVVSSANPHDASSLHSNTALAFSGPAVADLLASELAVLQRAGVSLGDIEIEAEQAPSDDAGTIQVLTEGAVRDAALAMIDAADQGDELMLATFYLAHRPIIDALKRARQRGVTVSALLDSNRDAFGREKSGIPNRPVAAELMDGDVTVRWCATQGEQCHSKWLMHRSEDGTAKVLSGSSNFTRRNLDNLNLETSALLSGHMDQPELAQAYEWFQQRWSNANQRVHSLDYAEMADESRLSYWQYRLMELSGLSTF